MIWLTLKNGEIKRGDWLDPSAGAVSSGEIAPRSTVPPTLRHAVTSGQSVFPDGGAPSGTAAWRWVGFGVLHAHAAGRAPQVNDVNGGYRGLALAGTFLRAMIFRDGWTYRLVPTRGRYTHRALTGSDGVGSP